MIRWNSELALMSPKGMRRNWSSPCECVENAVSGLDSSLIGQPQNPELASTALKIAPFDRASNMSSMRGTG